MTNDLLYQLALSLVPGIGDVHAKSLVQAYGSAEKIFTAPRTKLEKLEGIGSARAHYIKSFNDFEACEAEMKFIEQYKIQPIFINSPSYPRRLLHCYDSPVLLYYRGNADLNHARIVSIVGTRNQTDYGRCACEQLVTELSKANVLIASGLAFGIDSTAHKAALKNQVQTVGVIAHGLDMIYPKQNHSLARQMTSHGGLLTDFPSGTKPDKQNFPKRNRIVAGMCDCLVVIESGIVGGSLITAEIANSYNKDVFAFPGRSTDPKSEGCNYLVRSNKAMLIRNAQDLLESMNWLQGIAPAKDLQRKLFLELEPNELAIYGILETEGKLHVDEIYFKSGLSSSAVASALLTLEMQGAISSLPGKLYSLL